jgi:hypothetical protein
MFWFEDSILEDGSGQVLAFDDPWTTAHGLLGGEQMGNVPESQRAAARPDYTGLQGWVAPTILPAADAYGVVLDTAGAFPRDVVTRTAIDEALMGGGEFGCAIRTQLDGDGNPSGDHPLMEGLVPGDAPADADGDGLPDAWESDHGLDPDDPSDSQTVLPGTGYSAIESWLHERAALLLWAES